MGADVAEGKAEAVRVARDIHDRHIGPHPDGLDRPPTAGIFTEY